MKKPGNLLNTICFLFCLGYFNTLQAETNVEKGNSFRDQGNNYKAKYYYQLALSKNENDTAALYQMAKMEHERGQYKISLKHLNSLIRFNQHDVDALILRSMIYSQQKHLNKALIDLELAEQLDNKNSTVQMLLENIHTTLGNTEKASQHIKNYQSLREQ